MPGPTALMLWNEKRRSCDLRFFFGVLVVVLTDYEQDDEQGGDQNDMSRSVHVIKNAVDFVHLCLLRAGVKPGSIVEGFGRNGNS